MMNEEIAEQKQVVRESLFKRHENLVVLSIFVGFASHYRSSATDNGGRTPVSHLHQPRELAEHTAASRRTGDRRRRHDDCHDIRGNRSLGRNAGFSRLHRDRVRNIEVAFRDWSFHPARDHVSGRARVSDGLHHFPH